MEEGMCKMEHDGNAHIPFGGPKNKHPSKEVPINRLSDTF